MVFRGVSTSHTYYQSNLCILGKIRFVRVANRKENTEDRVRIVWSLSFPCKISSQIQKPFNQNLWTLGNKRERIKKGEILTCGRWIPASIGIGPSRVPVSRVYSREAWLIQAETLCIQGFNLVLFPQKISEKIS